MYVTRHCNFEELSPWISTWNEMARGVPFRRWEWLEGWWRHYGQPNVLRQRRPSELYLLAVWDDDRQLRGIAPWYWQSSRRSGRVVKFLGDGDVCTDYLSVLCRPEDEEAVTKALADWLTNAATAEDSDCWDRIELSGVDAEDATVGRLQSHLHARGNLLHCAAAPNCWRIPLPSSWDEYLMTLSKPHRNRLRRSERQFLQSGRATFRRAHTEKDIGAAFDILVDLHQRRWQGRGEPGCFASHQFRAFQREVSQQLAAVGQAAICWLELDGRPWAVEYHLYGDGVVYAYQSGIDPERLEDHPGRLCTIATMRRAIEHDVRAFDFLRGNEHYKAHWRAKPRPMLAVRVVPARTTARLRHQAWLAGQNVKHWIKGGLQMARKMKTRAAATEEQ